MEDKIIEKKENYNLLNIDQACQALGLGRWSVYKLINQNVLRTIKIGKRRLVSVGAVQDFVASLEAEGGRI
jgi:excisionase family DNA binding protein